MKTLVALSAVFAANNKTRASLTLTEHVLFGEPSSKSVMHSLPFQHLQQCHEAGEGG